MVKVDPAVLAAADLGSKMLAIVLRAVAWLVIFLAIYRFCRQINQTFPLVPPLPLSCHLIDEWHAKEYGVDIMGDPRQVSWFIDLACRKGEQVICFMDNAPMPESAVRLKLGPFAFRKVPLVTDSDEHFAADSDLLFESAWFGRFMVNIEDQSLSMAMICDIVEAMRERKLPQARCRSTLNIIWGHETPLPPALRADLLRLGRRVNVRLVLFDQPEPAGADDEMEAEYDIVA